MDRAVQRYFTIVLLLVSLLSNAQKKDIAVVKDSTGNKVVQMSLATFAHYYQVEQNLEAIHDSLPALSKQIEAERALSDSIAVNLEAQIEISRKIIMKKQEGLDDCIEVAVEVEVDNLYLDYALTKEKKKKWPNRIKGGGFVILLMILFNAATP